MRLTKEQQQFLDGYKKMFVAVYNKPKKIDKDGTVLVTFHHISGLIRSFKIAPNGKAEETQ